MRTRLIMCPPGTSNSGHCVYSRPTTVHALRLVLFVCTAHGAWLAEGCVLRATSLWASLPAPSPHRGRPGDRGSRAEAKEGEEGAGVTAAGAAGAAAAAVMPTTAQGVQGAAAWWAVPGWLLPGRASSRRGRAEGLEPRLALLLCGAGPCRRAWPRWPWALLCPQPRRVALSITTITIITDCRTPSLHPHVALTVPSVAAVRPLERRGPAYPPAWPPCCSGTTFCGTRWCGCRTSTTSQVRPHRHGMGRVAPSPTHTPFVFLSCIDEEQAVQMYVLGVALAHRLRLLAVHHGFMALGTAPGAPQPWMDSFGTEDGFTATPGRPCCRAPGICPVAGLSLAAAADAARAMAVHPSRIAKSLALIASVAAAPATALSCLPALASGHAPAAAAATLAPTPHAATTASTSTPTPWPLVVVAPGDHKICLSKARAPQADPQAQLACPPLHPHLHLHLARLRAAAGRAMPRPG